MKLVIFGATGTVGIQLVNQSLQQGHVVTAFSRTGEKLRDIKSFNLKIVTGNIENAHDVENAIRDQDAVLCVIGDGNKGKVRAIGTKNIIDGMQKTGVKRLVCQSTLGLGDSAGNLNFFWKHIMFGMLLKKAFKDHQYQEEFVFDSPLDYTLVRPSAFSNGELTNKFKVGFGGDEPGLSLKISRADTASFLLGQLQDRTYLRKAVSISN